MRYFFATWVLLATIFLMPWVSVEAAPLEVVGQGAVLVDGSSGQVLYEKNAHKKLYPASTTKMLTAIIALERGNLTDSVLIPPDASDVEGSAIGLRPGEKITLEDLLYALMLNSGNDSAVAIAVHIGGSVSGFVDLMNRKAAELGAVNSHFKNPNGLPDNDHYTTAYDLALITRYAMQNEEFKKIVCTMTRDIHRDDPEAQTFLLNHNKMLWDYKGAVGVKTGYTTLANQCLITAARREGRDLIAVVLGSEGTNIWSDSKALLDFGFIQFEKVRFTEAGKYIDEVPVKYGDGNVVLQTARAFSYDFPVGGADEAGQEVILKTPVYAPVDAGEKLGEMIFTDGGNEIGRVDLLAQKSVKRKWHTYSWPWIIAAALFLWFIRTYLRYQRRARQKRWQVYYQRKNRWDF